MLIAALSLTSWLASLALSAQPELFEVEPKIAEGAGAPVYLEGVVTMQESSASDANDIKVVQVECPAGTWVIGGNAQLTSSAAVGDILTLAESRPMDLPDQGWLAIGYETVSVAGNWFMLVRAICADVPNVQRIDLETATTSSSTKALTADCPAGTRVLGGGAAVLGPLFPVDLSLAGSVPGDFVGTRWDARGVEWTPTSISWRLRVIALCANLANPFQIATAAGFGFVDTITVLSKCPPGYQAIGGGSERSINIPNERILLQQVSTNTGQFSSSTGGSYDSLTNIFFNGSTRSICIVPYVFGDGLESGDTSAWSSTQ